MHAQADDLGYPPAPGDLALTPTGRLVRVDDVLPHGRRACTYLDLEGGEVELRASLLRVTSRRPRKQLAA